MGREARLSEPLVPIGTKKSKNYGSQFLFILGLIAVFLGGVMAYGGSFVGLALLVVGICSLVGIAWWAIKNWDY